MGCRRGSPRCDGWMSEVAAEVAAHTQTLHDATGAPVAASGVGDQLDERQLLECIGDRRRSCLCRKPPSPTTVARAASRAAPTAGAKGSSARTARSPAQPTNDASPGSSSAHRPKPRSTNERSISAMNAALPAREYGPGRCSTTSGSAFIAAHGSRSPVRQRRNSSRSVRSCGAALTAIALLAAPLARRSGRPGASSAG